MNQKKINFESFKVGDKVLVSFEKWKKQKATINGIAMGVLGFTFDKGCKFLKTNRVHQDHWNSSKKSKERVCWNIREEHITALEFEVDKETLIQEFINDFEL